MPFAQTAPTRQHSRFSFIYNVSAEPDVLITQVTAFDTNDAAEDDEWYTIGSQQLSDAQSFDETVRMTVIVPHDADQLAALLGITPPASWVGTEVLTIETATPVNFEIRRYDKAQTLISKTILSGVRWRTQRWSQSASGDGFAQWELEGLATEIYDMAAP